MCSGIYVKDIRENYGFTQKEFAFYFGVKLRTVQNWESRGCSENIYQLLNRCFWSDRARVVSDDNEKFRDFMRERIEHIKDIYSTENAW